MELRSFINELTSGDHYIARSEYLGRIAEYKDVVDYFTVLRDSKMLADFCTKNRIDAQSAVDTIRDYENITALVDKINDKYVDRKLVSEKVYLDKILYDVDPVIQLDEDQRRVVLTDEDYSLVIAGAGAGKTTTVAAKVKYLVDKQKIDPRDILVISFTNKAVGELKDKINKDLKIDCPIATFHSTGNAILHIHNDEKLKILDSSRMYYHLQDYFKSSVLNNERLVNNLILFFASYFDAPYEGHDLNDFFNKIAKGNYSTLKSDLDEYKAEIIDARTKNKVTIQNEFLRSFQEVEIANFLYMNGIDYEYEPIYPYNIPGSNKPYTPDFILRQDGREVYLEHFGISSDGKNDMFTPEEIQRYKKAVNDKITLHRQHNTPLIYTFSAYSDQSALNDHIKEQLEKCGFELRPRSNKDIMEKLVSNEESRYIRRLLNLICRFIVNFKTNGFGVDEFDRMYHSTNNVRSKLFLNICQDCYMEYERFLREQKAVDFEDLINESAHILRQVKEMKQRLHFKYIIVDEYQDISRQRFDLTKALSEVTYAKIIAVGDDWQSIYSFSGSDISLFTKFEEKMGYAKLLKIVRTYRNSQDVIDIAGNFIQKNPDQIGKRLLSDKRLEDPVIIYTYDGKFKKQGQDRRSGANYATAFAVQTAIEQILVYDKESGRKTGSILLLGRYGFDGDALERSGLFEYIRRGNKVRSVKYPKLKIDFMTVHMSKGLGYDNVIVINARNETYGFPSKIEDDPVLSFVIKGDNSIEYAEERRLFYVAMTRTRNRVYFIAPEQNPSEFLLEIKHDYKNVVLRGNWNEEEIERNTNRKYCPICGYPMQLRYKKAYGLRLYICTNEPELCGFMTNDMAAGKLGIMKCDSCADGYLIVRSKVGAGYFLGCTNYKRDKTGCGRMISALEYYKRMNYTDAPAEPVKRTDPRNTTPKEAVAYKEQTEQKSTTIADEFKRKSNNAAAVTPTVPVDIYVRTPQIKEKVTYKQYDLNNVLYTMLVALEHMSEKYFYGIGMYMAVLRGGDREKMAKGNLKQVPEYGVYANMSRDDMRGIIQWMIKNHYILRTKEKYPTLHLTYEGNHYCECITQKQLKDLKKYLEDPGREIYGDANGG